VTGYSGTVTVTSSDTKATITPGSQTLTNGVGTFSVTLNSAGSQSVSIHDNGSTPLTNSIGGLTVNATIWVVNSNGTLSKLNASGGADNSSSSGGGGLSGSSTQASVSFDNSGDVWSVTPSANTLAEFNSSGTQQSGSGGYTGGGLNNPVAVSVDGSGKVWVANSGNNSVSLFNSSGTAISGSGGVTGCIVVSNSCTSALSSPTAMALDISGSVWVTNGGSSGSVTQIIGPGSPVVSPMVTAVSSNQMGVKP